MLQMAQVSQSYMLTEVAKNGFETSFEGNLKNEFKKQCYLFFKLPLVIC